MLNIFVVISWGIMVIIGNVKVLVDYFVLVEVLLFVVG